MRSGPAPLNQTQSLSLKWQCNVSRSWHQTGGRGDVFPGTRRTEKTERHFSEAPADGRHLLRRPQHHYRFARRMGDARLVSPAVGQPQTGSRLPGAPLGRRGPLSSPGAQGGVHRAGLFWRRPALAADSGTARPVEAPDWAGLLPRWVSTVQPDALYLVVRVTPSRIDLVDEDLGWGVQETVEW